MGDGHHRGHQNLFTGRMGSEEKQRWSLGTTMITGVKGLRLEELERHWQVVGQPEQQLKDEHHGDGWEVPWEI